MFQWLHTVSFFHAAYEALAVNELRYLQLKEKKYGVELDVPAARAKELVRDGVQALVAAHRDTEQQRGTLTGPISTTPPRAAGLTDTVRGDVDAGRGLELADLAALDALDSDEHTLVEGSVAGRGPSEGTLWRTRLRAARNAVTWAFRSHQEEPPSDLLDRILRRLPAQDIGVALVDHEEVDHSAAQEAPRRRRMLAVVGVTALLVVAALLIPRLAPFRRLRARRRRHLVELAAKGEARA